MSEIVIRRAVPADAEAYAALGRATFTEAFGHLYPAEDLADFLDGNHTVEKAAGALSDPDTAVWFADLGGRPIGFSQASLADMPHPDLRPDHGELKRLYVLGDYQNARLGKRLIEPALAWLEDRGHRPIWISVWSENLGGQRFYERYGFRNVGEYPFVVGRWRDREFIYKRD